MKEAANEKGGWSTSRPWRSRSVMFELEELGPPLTDEQLVRLEKELGVRLPEQYRSFLFVTDGGIPDPNVAIDVEGAPWRAADLQVFFGIDRSAETSTIGWWLREARERFPEGTVPIAIDSGGNLFCICLSKEPYGEVIYLDSQSGYLDRGSDVKVYTVAKDFEEFLSKLNPY